MGRRPPKVSPYSAGELTPCAMSGGNRHVPGVRSIPIPAELVTVFILDAGLNARKTSHFVIMSAFAATRRPISRAAVHIILLTMPVSARGSVILILVHDTAHLPMHLTHPVHIHRVLASLLASGPIAINPRVLSPLAV